MPSRLLAGMAVVHTVALAVIRAPREVITDSWAIRVIQDLQVIRSTEASGGMEASWS